MAFSLVAATGAFAADADPARVEPVSIGLFRTGMTLDELKAAAPQASWTDNESAIMDPKHEHTYRAGDVMALDERQYSARIHAGWYGEYELQLYRKAEERNEAACMKVYEGLQVYLEDRFGAFEATNLAYDKESIFETQGKPTRTENRNTGKASSYTWHKNMAFVEATSRRAHPSGELKTVGQYFVDSPLFGTSTCITSFTIDIKGQRPEFEEVAAANLKLVRTPSLGTLHNSLEGVTVPAGGLTFKARCRLARNTGEIGNCEYEAEPAREISNALFWRKEEMAFDATGFAAGNPVPLFANLEFRIEAKERLALGAPASPLTPDQIEWSKPPALVAERSLITSGINTARRDEGVDTATVTTDCQVQADASLACLKLITTLGEGVVNEPYNLSRFESEARENLADRRAAATTKTGQPTRGKWVHFELPFNLRHDSLELSRERVRKLLEEREKRRQSRETSKN